MKLHVSYDVDNGVIKGLHEGPVERLWAVKVQSVPHSG